jgi:hypothetical protein
MEVEMLTEVEALKRRLYGGELKAKNIKFFPGTNTDADGEDMSREINKFFADPKETETDGEISSD